MNERLAQIRDSPLLIWLFLVLGTLVRCVYAIRLQPWNQAPDQLAWEYVLDFAYSNSQFGYQFLIHYPHEGGTIVLSLLALMIKSLGIQNTLSIVAFLVDVISRFIQLFVARKLLSSHSFVLFGAWTVVSMPSILPWASVNFGLHSIASFFPFFLLYLLAKPNASRKSMVIMGLALGLALWFAYDSIVLIPVVFFYVMRTRDGQQGLLLVAASFSLIILLHILVRIAFDAGFHYHGFEAHEIRGLGYEHLWDIETYRRIYLVFSENFPAAILLPDLFGINAKTTRILFGLITAIGAGMLLRFDAKSTPSIKPLFWIVICFFIVYALSPFYDPNVDHAHYVTVRHWSYILPSVALVTIEGLSQKKTGKYLAIIYLLMCSTASVKAILAEGSNSKNTQAAGWVLGTKFGNNLDVLSAISSKQKIEDRAMLVSGYAWSITSALFSGNPSDEELEIMRRTFLHFDDQDADAFKIGVEKAFSEGMQPNIDIVWKKKIDSVLAEMDN